MRARGDDTRSDAVDGSQHLASDALGDDEDAAGDDVAVAVAPDFELEDDAALKVFEAGEGLDVDDWLLAGVHDLLGSAAAFFAWLHSISS